MTQPPWCSRSKQGQRECQWGFRSPRNSSKAGLTWLVSRSSRAAAGALRLRAHTHADPDARRADIAAALELARRQGATLFELRAALDDFDLRGEPACRALATALSRLPADSAMPKLPRARAVYGPGGLSTGEVCKPARRRNCLVIDDDQHGPVLLENLRFSTPCTVPARFTHAARWPILTARSH